MFKLAHFKTIVFRKSEILFQEKKNSKVKLDKGQKVGLGLGFYDV
jgi:hypothetical protein